MRVFSGALATETNTFAPMPTGLASFRERGYYPAGTHPDAMSFFAGAALGGAAARQGARLGPASRAWWRRRSRAARPRARPTRPCATNCSPTCRPRCRSTWSCSACTARWSPTATTTAKATCWRACAQLVGPKVVVGAELDPHNHLTRGDGRQRRPADRLQGVPAHRRPRTRATSWSTCARPRSRARSIPSPPSSTARCWCRCTPRASRRAASSTASRRSRASDGILSISVSHGFAWGDIPDMGTKMLVYTDGDAAKAQSAGAPARRRADRPARRARASPTPTSTARSTRRWPSTAGRWCSPTAPTTPAAAPPATRPSSCGACSSAASATPASARSGTRSRRASPSTPASARRLTAAHRRQDQRALGRPGGRGLHREGDSART